MTRRIILSCIASVAGLGLFGSLPAPAAVLRVFVSIPPQADLVERLGGDLVAVTVLVPPGQEPHTFEVTPRQAMALGGADLYLRIGLPFEERIVGKLALADQGPRLVDTTLGIAKRRMTAADTAAHEAHGEHAEHAEHETHGEADHLDPHVWLAPPLIKQLASNIAAALVQAAPEHRAIIRANLSKLHAQLDQVHKRLKQTLAPFAGRDFYVFHPAFGYFGDSYDLHQQAVELEGKAPSPRQLRQLIQQARQAKVRVIFVQPQFDQRSAEAVAQAINGAVVALDPLARDLLANLESMATQMRQALSAEATQEPQ